MLKAMRHLMVGLALVLSSATLTFGRTINIRADGTGDYANIGSAVLAASDGDEIVLQPGVYPGDIGLRGKTITIRSTNPTDPAVVAATVIANGYRGFDLNSGGPGMMIAGLTIRDCQTDGIQCYSVASPTIRHCVVQDCERGIAAGSNSTIYACTVTRCQKIGISGGSQILNCLVVGIGGPGITAGVSPGIGVGANVIVRGCTSVGNYLGISCPGTHGTISNCIVWGNTNGQISTQNPIGSHYNGSATVSFSIVAGGYAGTAVLDVDPLVTADGHLQAASPAIQAGNPVYTPAAGETDIDGEPRMADGRIDIGADEFVDADGDGLPDWWETKYFGSATAGDAAADPDGDGLTNLREYVLGSSPLAGPNTYYADPVAGNDAWDGLAMTWDGTHGPRKTVQKAIDAARPMEDDNVVLLPGTYSGPGNYNISLKGKAITVRSYNPDNEMIVAATIVRAQSLGQSGFVFAAGETSRSIVSGLTITGFAGTTNEGYINQAVDCQAGSPVLSKCRLTANATAIRCQAKMDIQDCVITRCSDIAVNAYGTTALTNCLIANNATTGVRSWGATTIANCTITSGISCGFTASLQIANSIVWNAGLQGLYPNPGSTAVLPVVSYSIVRGGYAGTGNTDADPLLTPDGHLQAGSPAINAGDPTCTPPAGAMDIDDEPRLADGQIDIGADEFVDTNVDALPDWWELKHFGYLCSCKPLADSDEDGLTNAQEYAAGSNPLSVPLNCYVNPAVGNDAWDGLAVAWDGSHGPKKTIAAAVSATREWENDNVVLAAGTYHGTGNYDVDLNGKAITIRSADPNDPETVKATIIQAVDYYPYPMGTQRYEVFRFGPGATNTSVVAGLTIVGGSTAISGGGMVRHCRFVDNVTAIACSDNAIVRNCLFVRNGGDVVTISTAGLVQVLDCIFTRNNGTCVFANGALAVGPAGMVEVRNCTMVNNSGYGIRVYSCPLAVRNCILRNNGPSQISTYDAPPTVSHSIVQGGYAGIGNLDVDPQLTPDLHLRADSPAVDAGDPACAPASWETDWDGEARAAGLRVDIGADELIDVDGDGMGDWFEAKYFGSSAAGDPAGDLDGDGLTNLQEYDASRNPLTGPLTYWVDAAAGNDSWDGLASVAGSGHGPKKTVQAAIDAASSYEGDAVVLLPGTHRHSSTGIDTTGKAITIRSTDPADPAVVAATIVSVSVSDTPVFWFHTAETATSVLDGLTIAGAFSYAAGGYEQYGPYYGGGIRIEAASPTIRNCVIRDNTMGYGGGISCSSGSPLITRCRFERNHTVVGGGALYISGGAPTLAGCTILDNTADSVFGSNPTGAGVLVSYASPVFRNCLIARNGTANGFVAYGYNSNSITLEGCTIAGASGATNLIVAGSQGTRLVARNCIIWGASGTAISLFSGASATVTYSDVQGGFAGAGNLNIDPRLTADWHVAVNSPCIGAGDPDYLPAASDTDIDGDPRVVASRIDMGADEFHWAGDINADGRVDVADLLHLVDAFGSLTGDANYDPQCDFNSDGSVDVVDLLVLAENFGT